jgi:ribosomal protein L31
MLIPIIGQNFPSNGSSKLIYFDCSCGNKNILKRWKYYVNGHTKTCGQCGIMNVEYWKNTKFGKLRMKYPIDIHKMSNKKVTWLCDCGNETKAQVCLVYSGNTNSCGKCNILAINHWKNTKYGKLKLKNPIDLYKNSHELIKWICDCGNETKAIVANVTRGKQISCGKCNLLTAEYWKNTKFGKVKMKHPIDIHGKSAKKVVWVCDCGREFETKVNYVTYGDTKTCGKCNLLPASYWVNAKFGRLKMKNPIDIHPSVHKKIIWLCDCGNEVKSYIFNVTRGLSSSCGMCYLNVITTYNKNKHYFLNLKTPIHPNQVCFPIRPLDIIYHTEKPFKAICPMCESEYKPIWGNIRLGRSLTCGCSTNRTSKPQKDISEFINSIGHNTELEYEVNKLKYDIFVPSKNLLIEYNGLKWHSMTTSKQRDLKKYKNATYSGFDYLMIFEDEWMYDQTKVKGLIQNKLGNTKSISLRPSKCQIKLILYSETSSFYNQFHYIGPCKSKINYGVYYQNKLIACMSFKKPTRQSKHDFELVRMASDPQFKVHGIWSKLLKQFQIDNNSNSIVSFSDNRLFSGGVYEKIGFKFDGEIPPDYYWVKGQKRFHKSGLRKTKEEKLTGLTEYQLREDQGYKKIWDLGKKRWVI